MSLARHILGEAAKHKQKESRQKDLDTASVLLSKLFPAQYDFVTDPAKRKAALCPRRSGKSFAVLVYSLVAALRRPKSRILIVGRVRRQVKGVYWRDLKQMLRDHEIQLSHPPRNMELEVEFKNGSTINLGGADTAEEIDKYRGQRYDLVCLDECKSYSSSLLEEMITEIIRPALLDRRGTLALIGTPGPIPTGPFYAITTGDVTVINPASARSQWTSRHWTERDEKKRGFAWSRHSWHTKDNTANPDIWVGALEEKELAGISDDDPRWCREYLGLWVPDTDALVYAYARLDDGRCDAKDNPEGPYGLPNGHDWKYILGLDIGYSDATAFVVAAWAETHDKLHFVHAEKHQHLVVDDIAARARKLEQLYTEGKGFYARIADKGALGTMVVESLGQTYGIHFEPAEKREKHDHIKIMNSEMVSGRIQTHEAAYQLKEEWRTMQWAGEDRRIVDPNCDDHCADAALYVWRYAYHHFSQPLETAPEPGSKEWWKQKEYEDMKAREAELMAKKNTAWWKQFSKRMDKNPLEGMWIKRHLRGY